jgi:peptidoglycan-associated lipoprotein
MVYSGDNGKRLPVTGFGALALAVCLTGALVAAGCAKKVTKTPAALPEPAPAIVVPQAPTERASFDTVDVDKSIKEALMPVYFAFNDSRLNPAALEQMQQIGRLMDQHKALSLLMEGYCDERGSSEYNIGLGERRARAVKDWLLSYGIAEARLETTSYGKERLAVEGCGDDACHAKNRRVAFKVLAR